MAEGCINLNKASREELMNVDYIGPEGADSIIKYREEHGELKSVDELKDVYHFGPELTEMIKEQKVCI